MAKSQWPVVMDKLSSSVRTCSHIVHQMLTQRGAKSGKHYFRGE